MDTQSPDTPSSLPDEFIDQVKQALEHLYDFPFLQRHPLARESSADKTQADEPSGHRLRRELISAIETLNPGKTIAVRSGAARVYNLMHLHYVGGMTIQEAAHELGVSMRQAYRDLRRGQESVAEILAFQREQSPSPARSQEAVELSSIQEEVTRLESEFTSVNLSEALNTALKAVEKLAEQQNLRLDVTLPKQPLVVLTNAIIARQIFINLLSRAIQQSDNGMILVRLESLTDGARLTLHASARRDSADSALDTVMAQLVEQIGWTLAEHNDKVTVTTTRRGPSILIIDDNEGLVDLLERYFTGYAYQVVSATSGAAGLELARTTQPDAIVLDLMMPGMDGWELLQRLRTTPETMLTPVIICSVINDPELAFSLGASQFIAKPVTKETILKALQELEI